MARLGQKVANVVAVDNHPRTAGDKARLRELVLAEVDAPVFDAFAGSGEMFRRVWHKAPGYVGCDLRWFPEDPRLAFVADNRRVLRAIDLARFGIFDLDAYGSPWEQVVIIAGRRSVRPGERIGLVLTDGSSLKLKMGGAPKALALLCGMRASATGLGSSHDELITRATRGLARRMGCDLVRAWRARGKSAARVIYLALVLEGLPIEQRLPPSGETSSQHRAA
jgi:hypothetical protein